MSANLFRLKKMKINVEFKGRNFNIEVQPYKTIKYVKDQAKNFFFPMRENMSIYYQNKDLSSYESNLIGDYFKKRTTVALRLLPMNTNPNSESRQKVLSSHSQGDKFPTYICSCSQEGIEYYCRSCKDFICNACRMSPIHANHNVVQVDSDNLEESAKLYAITLQAEILYNIKSTHDYYVKFQNQNFIEASARQEMFIRKLNKIHSLYNEMIKELSFNRTKSIESLMDNFNQQAKKAHVELESLLTLIYQKYTKGKMRMTYEEMKEFFEEINEREKTFEEESCDALGYKVNYEINTNIDAMYNRLDEIADEVLNMKIPFRINLNSYYTYEMIKAKNNRQVNYQDQEQNIPYLEQNKEVKIDESSKTKELKQVPTERIKFKNRYVINAKDKDRLEIQNSSSSSNNNQRPKEVIQKNIIADKGYDECVNISDNNNNMNSDEKINLNDNNQSKLKSNEEDDLLDLVGKNEQKNNERIEERSGNSLKDKGKDKKSIDNDNKEEEDNDLLDSLNFN